MTITVPGPLVVLTDRRAAEGVGRSLVDTVAVALGAGAHAVLLREKDLPAEQRRVLATRLVRMVAASGAKFGIASDATLASQLGVHWVHLSASGESPPPAGRPGIVGRSCHDTDELHAAAVEGCEYASLSPVLTTSSKPGYGPALGMARLAEQIADAGLPVAALGGLGAGRGSVTAALAAGAAAVWVMGAVMGAADPGRVVRDLVAEIDAVRVR
jgi:thiamine-phosphate pyrophosphorylase